MDTITYTPIDVMHTPFLERVIVPIQTGFTKDVEGAVAIFPEYVDGLKGAGPTRQKKRLGKIAQPFIITGAWSGGRTRTGHSPKGF